MSVGVTVLGLLMLVMCALLRQATTLRTDMEAVI
jgi:heme exporter protein D